MIQGLMMQYLVDTDWAIEYMRRREPVTNRLVELFPCDMT